MTDEVKRDRLESLLLAVCTLLADEREKRVSEGDVKTEVLLSGCGLDAATIGTIVRKRPSSIRSVLSRSRASE